MKRKIAVYFFVLGVIFIITACATTKNTLKGNCTALDCIKELKIENSVEDINDVIGFDGKLIDEKNKVYSWEIGEDNKILATYYDGDKATIEAKYNIEELKDEKVDFSNYSEIQSLLKKGTSLTLEEFNEKVKGTGLLYLLSPSSKKYIWVNKDGEYLNANFSTSTGKCTFVTGKLEKK